jgi:hypothetical protein
VSASNPNLGAWKQLLPITGPQNNSNMAIQRPYGGQNKRPPLGVAQRATNSKPAPLSTCPAPTISGNRTRTGRVAILNVAAGHLWYLKSRWMSRRRWPRSPHGGRAPSDTPCPSPALPPPLTKPTHSGTFLVRWGNFMGELGCRQQPLASRVWGKKLHKL